MTDAKMAENLLLGKTCKNCKYKHNNICNEVEDYFPKLNTCKNWAKIQTEEEKLMVSVSANVKKNINQIINMSNNNDTFKELLKNIKKSIEDTLLLPK